MIGISSNRVQSRGVIAVGPPMGDEGWLEYAAALEALSRESPPAITCVIIQSIGYGVDMPSALVRKRLATIRAQVRANVINAVVTTSRLIRTMQTALDWLQRPAYESSTHPDLESALAHIERLLGRAEPDLRAHWTQAHAALNAKCGQSGTMAAVSATKSRATSGSRR